MRKIDPTLLNVGMYLAIPILLGVFLGYQLDKWLGTKPLFMIGLIVFGTISSFYNLWKLTKDIQNDRKNR